MILSKTDKIDGVSIYEPTQGSAVGNKSIYDSNSGYTANGTYKFKVKKTIKYKQFNYERVNNEELQHLLNLLFDEDGNIKEFVFECEFMGKPAKFYAKLDNDFSVGQLLKGKIYSNVNFTIIETRVKYE